MHFCGLCGNMIDGAPMAFEGETFHRECLLTDDDVSPVVQIIMEEFKTLDKIQNYLFFAPEIPKDRLAKALRMYAGNVLDDRVVALYDCTLDNTAENGFLVSTAGFYARNPVSFEKWSVLFNEITKINTIKEADGEISRIELDTAQGPLTLERGLVPSLNLDFFTRFLQKLIKLRANGLLDTTDNFIVIQDMASVVKLTYIKLILNMVAGMKKKIRPEDLEEMELLMSQLDFEQELRIQAREYLIANEKENTGRLIFELEDNSPKGSQKGLRICLLKDLLRFYHRMAPGAPQEKNAYLNAIRELFDFHERNMGVILTVCENDEAMLKPGSKDKEMQRQARWLASKADVAGVPAAAAYLSGTTFGLNAKDLIVGFASLNVHDELRLSSMADAEGEVVLFRPEIQTARQRVVGAMDADFEKANLILQLTVHAYERAAVRIAEDVGYYTNDLLAALKMAGTSKQDIEKRAEKIKRVSLLMNNLMKRSGELEKLLVSR